MCDYSKPIDLTFLAGQPNERYCWQDLGSAADRVVERIWRLRQKREAIRKIT